jgi:glycosyltransferase involved in cell wall biosynthesis
LRILQISSAQFLGGGERYLADLANNLARRGHEVFAALRENSPLADELRELSSEDIVTLSLRNSIDAVSARQLSSFVKKHNIDLVHAHMARDYPIAAYATARNKPTRLVVTRHVLFPLGRLHRLTLARVSRVIAVSQAVALQLRAERIVPTDRISVIPNGIDVARFDRCVQTFDRQKFISDWKLPPDRLLVGTVGELKALKGQEEFLLAAKQVLGVMRNVHFIIAGVDSSQNHQNRRHLEQLVEQWELAEHVTLVDWVKDVGSLYCALDLFVSASRAESFGLAIAEAMACGTAVVSTKTEGAKEIIDGGQSGLLVPVGNAGAVAGALLELLQDEAERKRIGKNAAQRIRQQFTLEQMVDRTEKLYQEV